MKIQQIEIDELIPYDNNTRTHSAAQFESLAQSIAKFQWTQPIVVDEQNVILAGHARYAAAQSLGEKTVPVIKLEGLSENDKKAYRIVDNKLALDSDWNYDLLKLEIADLQAADYDLTPFNLNDLVKVFSERSGEGTDYDDTGEKLDNYLANKVNQIVLYFSAEQYVEILEALAKVQNTHGVDNNTAVFLILLDFYAANYSNQEETRPTQVP